MTSRLCRVHPGAAGAGPRRNPEPGQGDQEAQRGDRAAEEEAGRSEVTRGSPGGLWGGDGGGPTGLCVWAGADSDRLEHQLEEAVTLRQDYESSASKLRTLEKQVKSLRQEKDDVHKVAELRQENHQEAGAEPRPLTFSSSASTTPLPFSPSSSSISCLSSSFFSSSSPPPTPPLPSPASPLPLLLPPSSSCVSSSSARPWSA